MLTEVVEGVYLWRALEVALKRYINGYLLVVHGGTVLIDPPAAAEPVLRAIEALGRPRAVILTGQRQERRARQYQGWYDAKVFAPEGDQRALTVKADVYYKHAESLPGGLRAFWLKHQRSAGESTLFHSERKLLFAGHLVGDPPGHIRMQDRGLYPRFSRSLQAQLALLKLPFEVLLPGRGEPITKGGRLALATHIAGYRDEF